MSNRTVIANATVPPRVFLGNITSFNPFGSLARIALVFLVIAALGCGGCSVLGLWLIGLFLSAIFAPLRIIGQSATCQSNVFHLARGFRMYADDYDDHLKSLAAAVKRYPDEPTLLRESVSTRRWTRSFRRT